MTCSYEEAFDQHEPGRFDVVIGNPPYILIQDINRNDDFLDYFKIKYFSSSYKIDTYHLFIEKGILLLNNSGLLGLITPSNYMINNGLKKSLFIAYNLFHLFLNGINIKKEAGTVVTTFKY